MLLLLVCAAAGALAQTCQERCHDAPSNLKISDFSSCLTGANARCCSLVRPLAQHECAKYWLQLPEARIILPFVTPISQGCGLVIATCNDNSPSSAAAATQTEAAAFDQRLPPQLQGGPQQFPQQSPQFPQQSPQFPQQFPQQQSPQFPQQFPQQQQQSPQFPQQFPQQQSPQFPQQFQQQRTSFPNGFPQSFTTPQRPSLIVSPFRSIP